MAQNKQVNKKSKTNSDNARSCKYINDIDVI